MSVGLSRSFAATLRQVKTAFPTSVAIARAFAGVNSKYEGASKARTSEAVLSWRSMAVSPRGLMYAGTGFKS